VKRLGSRLGTFAKSQRYQLSHEREKNFRSLTADRRCQTAPWRKRALEGERTGVKTSIMTLDKEVGMQNSDVRLRVDLSVAEKKRIIVEVLDMTPNVITPQYSK
jgi:hypothetical protein